MAEGPASSCTDPDLCLVCNMKTARGLWSRAEKGVEDWLLWSSVYMQQQPGMAVL